MKKLFFLVTLAAALLCGCNKDNGEKNFITYGNDTADINVGPCGYIAEDHQVGGPGYHFDSDFILKGVSGHLFLHISASCKGKKVDLGKYNSNVAFDFEINSDYEHDYVYDIHHYNTEYSGGEVGHSSVGTWFKSGTMELKDDGKVLSLDVDATLQDGRAFKMNITTDSKKFE